MRAAAATDRMPKVSLLTGGGDTQYAVPLSIALAGAGVPVEVVGSNLFLASRDFRESRVPFVNVHGNMESNKPLHEKVLRVLGAYVKLAWYAASTDSEVFHILWHNTFKFFDRIVVTAYYKALGKKLFFTVHNVDIDERDGGSNVVGRSTLKFMYRMMDHIFVHTEKMKTQLERDFSVPAHRITVHPFGINTTPVDSDLTRPQARERLGIEPDDKVALFFGNLAAYKGLEYLVRAFAMSTWQSADANLRLIIAGNVKGREAQPYWEGIKALIDELGLQKKVLAAIRYIPDDEVEVFFKASDVCVLPYVYIYQTGVIFTSYRFGLPVIVTDAGSMREDVIEGRTGFVCRASDASDLARSLDGFFGSALLADRERVRVDIVNIARSKYSWESISATIAKTYEDVRSPRARAAAPEITSSQFRSNR
jgi:D-inositol-3-phosphate glycosyltransferase